MAAGEVWCVTPSASGGWAPITALAELTGRVWDSTPRFIHPTAPYGRTRKALALLPRRRRNGRSLLLIAAQPGDLLALARPPCATVNGQLAAITQVLVAEER